MDVIKCAKNHYYDKDVFGDECPHCASGLEPFDNPEDEDINFKLISIYAETDKEKKKRLKQEKKIAKLEMKEAKKLQSANDKKKTKKANKSKGKIKVDEAALSLEETTAEQIAIDIDDSEVTEVYDPEETVAK